MWINKKKQQKMESELHSIELERDKWKAKYLAVTMELKQIVQELKKYKQKYADEVQKRIDLAEQMKG